MAWRMSGTYVALTDEWLGLERGSVTFSDGDRPTGSITGVDFTFEPLPGPEGRNADTTVRNAAFGFAEEFRVGKSSGHSTSMGSRSTRPTARRPTTSSPARWPRELRRDAARPSPIEV
jgi:hypothetical protein